jgi:hypothetical protein
MPESGAEGGGPLLAAGSPPPPQAASRLAANRTLIFALTDMFREETKLT